MNSQWKNSWLLLAWTFFFFAGMWLLDFPKPLIDDLAYCGAAVNLAGGGDLSNPWLLRYQLPGHFFFLSPPFHSFALAGWLKLFGVSARAMTAFPVTMYFVTAVSTIAFLRRRQAPGLILWLVPLGVSTALLSVGLRPEPFSIALTMAGFALFDCGPRNAWSRGIAFLLLFLGGSVAPRMTVFSAALVVFALDTLQRERKPGSSTAKWGLWAPPTVASIFSISLFLGLIHFRLGEFLHTFHFVSRVVTGGKLTRLVNYLNDNPFLNNAQFPLVLLTAALFVFAWPPQRCELKRLSLFVAAAFPVVALLGGLAAGTLWYIVLVLFLFVSAVLNQQPELGPRLKATLFLALLLANVKAPMTVYGQLAHHTDTDRGPDLAAVLGLRPTPEHSVLVDSWVARYVFGYNLPPGFLDVNFAAPFPKHSALDDVHPGDIYLTGPETVEGLKEGTLLDMPVPTWAPFGLPNHRFPMHPHRVFVVRAEECHGRRGN